MEDKKQMMLSKNNLMVKARYSLTSKENKAYLFLLYNMQMKLLYQESDLLECVIPRSEFAKALPDVRDRGAKPLSKMMSSLRAKPLYFLEKDDSGNLTWGEHGFISSYKYSTKTDAFTIHMEAEALELLREYANGGYTPLNLVIMMSLEGYYAQRIYELVRLWSNTKNVVEYKVDLLKEYLMLDTKKSYKLYGHVKKKVIEPAIEEINKLGLIELSHEEVKVGNRVDSIRFIVKELNTKDSEKVMPDDKPGNKINTFIPDEDLFTKGTLRSVKKDFANIDFKNDYMCRAFDSAVMITLEQDDVETIKAASYNYFKKCLENKIEEYKKEEEEEINHKKEMEEYW